ncbi:MAG TPA: hypothetical protein VFP59_12485 [Candidatus Angelobacter sp.]|nr:hypothetical protein [Candidatus Angelobacter sp.]
MRVTAGAFVLTLALGCATAVPLLAQNTDNRGDQAQAQQPAQHYQAQEQRDRDQRPDQDRAQDQDRRADQDHDRMADNDRAYYGNKYFEQGWKDGLKHKHKNKKFKKDDDRMAYEAGFAHGNRGEAWHKPNKRDRDHDHDKDHDHDQH